MHLHHNLMALAAAGAIFLAPATSFADAASEAAQMAATPVQATDDSAAAQSACPTRWSPPQVTAS